MNCNCRHLINRVFGIGNRLGLADTWLYCDAGNVIQKPQHTYIFRYAHQREISQLKLSQLCILSSWHHLSITITKTANSLPLETHFIILKELSEHYKCILLVLSNHSPETAFFSCQLRLFLKGHKQTCFNILLKAAELSRHLFLQLDFLGSVISFYFKTQV